MWTQKRKTSKDMHAVGLREPTVVYLAVSIFLQTTVNDSQNVDIPWHEGGHIGRRPAYVTRVDCAPQSASSQDRSKRISYDIAWDPMVMRAARWLRDRQASSHTRCIRQLPPPQPS